MNQQKPEAAPFSAGRSAAGGFFGCLGALGAGALILTLASVAYCSMQEDPAVGIDGGITSSDVRYACRFAAAEEQYAFAEDTPPIVLRRGPPAILQCSAFDEAGSPVYQLVRVRCTRWSEPGCVEPVTVDQLAAEDAARGG